VRNGDFSRAGKDSVADQWVFSCDSRQANGTREPADGNAAWAIRLAMTSKNEKGQASVMLAQHDVPVRKDQWYRITLKARAEGMSGKAVNLALQDTKTWKPLFDYESFTPTEQWRSFQFLVQSKGEAERDTRFQIWHGEVGVLWLADIAMTPIAPPASEGRWLDGLYLDRPEAWDDPYRFFRW
jgi:hypothetical protein